MPVSLLRFNLSFSSDDLADSRLRGFLGTLVETSESGIHLASLEGLSQVPDAPTDGEGGAEFQLRRQMDPNRKDLNRNLAGRHPARHSGLGRSEECPRVFVG